MKVKTEKIKSIIEVSKQILTSHKKFEKNRDAMTDFDKSQKARDKHRNKMETEMQYIEERIHELHCLSVEAGIALFDKDRYKPHIYSEANGWGRVITTRREPKI